MRDHQGLDWHRDRGLVRALVGSLAQNLERELVRLECRAVSAALLKPVYDRIYLPTAIAVADALRVWCLNLDLLRQPLWAELASTQLRVVLECLYEAATVLCEG